MTDHDALANAVIADPDDDTARLVYADFIEEAGEPERAAFVRGQIELARTPDWEPFAARWRRQPPEEQAGDRWRPTLPWGDSWSPRTPFRRGFGYAVKTQSVRHLIEHGAELFASAPVGELHLPGGEMDDYRVFARQPWLPRVERVHFWMHDRPTEGVRALAASPLTTSLRAVHFENATSPGMSFLVEGLFQSHLGRQLRELSFRVGDGSQLDLIEAFEAGGPPDLERLTFDNMGLDGPAAERLAGSPVLPTLRHLAFRNMFFSHRQVEQLLDASFRQLESLSFHNTGLRNLEHDTLLALVRSGGSAGLRRLNFTKSYGFRDELPAVCTEALAGLRSLLLGRMNLEDDLVRQVVQAPFWPNLVELDLHNNPLTDRAGRYLLAATPAVELVTLDLRGVRTFSPRMRGQLRERYPQALLDQDAAQD